MGKPHPIPELSESDLARFWAKIDVRGLDDCWEWTAGTNPAGYGRIKLQRKLFLATRWAYFIEHGIDPGNKLVCHSCDNPPCCNPAHLWLGTYQDNRQDSMKKGRQAHQGGEHNGRAKLTDEDVRAILESEKFQWVLAEEYGVSPQTISNIKLGKTGNTWRLTHEQIEKHSRLLVWCHGSCRRWWGRMAALAPAGACRSGDQLARSM